MRVLITNKGAVEQDYTRYVIDGSVNVEDSINVPTLVSFQLANIDNLFQVPTRSSYVRIISDIFSPAGTLNVPGTAMPWNPADPSASYFVTVAGTVAPTIAVKPGQQVKLTYINGVVNSQNGSVGTDGRGVGPNSTGGVHPWPSDRLPGGFSTASAGECCGAFVDNTGLVLLTVRIDNGCVTPAAPPNTVALSVGVNDNHNFSLNTGSWNYLWSIAPGYAGGLLLATGFVTTEPERTYLGLHENVGRQNYQRYTYNIQVTSDEWLLNSNTVPYIPAFVNQTDSQILASIANALKPGFFDTTSFMATGTLVPYFQYDPAQTWSDIAKTFADANRFHYKVINKQITYQPFGDQPLGIAFDDQTQREKNLAPLDLKTGVVTVPPVNDCIVIGDVEPQANWDTYLIGDGFTSNFGLKQGVFQGTTSTLLQDDWTEAAFSQGQWIVQDPIGVFKLADNNGNAIGGLNIVQQGTPLGVYTPAVNATFIQGQNGLELGGGINLQHGQIVFTASGNGLIGSLFPDTNFVPGNVLAGYGISGQPALGTFNAVSVQILNAGSQLVSLTFNGTAPTILQSGNVCTCASFVGAAFLNGTKQSIKTIVQISPSQYVITLQGLLRYNAAYGPTIDSGSITFATNLTLITASGTAGVVVQPIFKGNYVGPKIVTQINHQYVLQTWIGAQAKTRYTRPYTNLQQSATFGNQNLAASGTISWVVTDVNLGDFVIEQQNPLFGLFPAAPPPVVTKYTQFGTVLPPFAIYCLANAINLNASINYTLLSLPPQGYLTVQSLTGASGGNLPWLPSQLSPPIHYMMGTGQINQTAQVSQSGEAFSLSFYTDDIPSVGARIRFQSWAAGQSVARVRDPLAIANEASITGDNGVRAAIMQNLSPLPRTSDECEAAAAAAILDREFPQFQGTYNVKMIPYKFENLCAPSLYLFPTSGRFLWINSPVRGVSGQNFFANSVRFQITELKQEVMQITVDYGPDLYLERLLPAFLERDQNLLTPKQTTAPPNPITIAQVLNAHLPTLDGAQITNIVNSSSGDYVVIDLGVIPVTGCEVRSIDSGWGIANQGRIGLFTTRVFTLPRTIRDQTWYLRTINGGTFSRFSKALRVAYPLIPSAPTLVQANTSQAVFDYAGDVRDIYGLEVRAFPVSGVLFYTLPTTPTDSVGQFVRIATAVSLTAQGNVLAVYNPPSNSATFPFGTQLQVGDLIIENCPGDNSFSGIEIVSQVVASTASTGPLTPANVTLNGADAYFYFNTNSDHGFQRFTATPASANGVFKGLTSLKFNGMGGGFQGNDPNVQPMQVDILDSNGIFHGRSVVWQFANSGYDMVVSGSLFVPTAGNHVIQISHDDSLLFGIQGATRVSGSTFDTSAHTVTPMLGLPILGANNHVGFFPFDTYVVNFAASGNFKFEIDYTQWKDYQTLVVQFDGVDVLPTPPGIGTGANSGTPWQYGFWDYGQPVPDTLGTVNFGTNNEVGTVQLLIRGSFAQTSFANIAGGYTGLVTVTTVAPHGFTAGESIIIGAGWGSWPSSGPPTPPQSGAVVCGQQIVTNVVNPTQYQFVISRFQSSSTVMGTWENTIAASGVSTQILNGVCAAMPSPQNFVLSSGILIQRPIFAPSDLIIDFTNPDIATKLEILQALSPNNRVGGLNAYFFNLTWDYSAPTNIPSFQIPTIVNVAIDGNTQLAGWQVATGRPSGYRVQIVDPVTGITYNKFTVDNPQNPQGLTQFKLLQQDFQSTRNIVITPFDALGDGIPYLLNNASQYSITGNQSPNSYTLGCTWDGPVPGNFVMLRIPLDLPVQYTFNFAPSQGYLETAPLNTLAISLYQIPAGQPRSAAIPVGVMVFSAGSRVAVVTSFGLVTNFFTGDVMLALTSQPPDPLAADLGFTISGVKN